MTSYRKLGKNMLSLTIGNFASKLLSFLFVPFYTAVLSTSEYGTADLVTTTVTLLFPFFSLIICESMLRFSLDKNENNEEVYRVGIIVWFCGLVLLILASPILLLVNTLKELWLLIVFYYVAYSLNQNIGYYTRGCENVFLYTVSGIVTTAATICLNLMFLLWMKMGLNGYLLASIIANLLSSLVMITWGGYYRFGLSIKNLDRSLVRRMLHYSLPMIPNSASWWVSNSSDKYIIILFSGVAVNGVYSVAYKIPTIITIVTSIFATAWRISAVEDFGSEKSKKFYSDVYSMYVTLTLTLASALMVVNKPLSSFLYQKDFYNAWQFVPILLIAAVVHAYCEFFGTLYTSAMKTKMLFYSTVIGAVTNIILNLLMIPSMAALGAAIATSVSYFVVWLIRMIHSASIMKLTYHYSDDIVCFALVLVQVVIASMTIKYEIAISAFIFLAIIIVRRNNIRQLIGMLTRNRI